MGGILFEHHAASPPDSPQWGYILVWYALPIPELYPPYTEVSPRFEPLWYQINHHAWKLLQPLTMGNGSIYKADVPAAIKSLIGWWRIGATIPSPLVCRTSALPAELIPHMRRLLRVWRPRPQIFVALHDLLYFAIFIYRFATSHIPHSSHRPRTGCSLLESVVVEVRNPCPRGFPFT